MGFSRRRDAAKFSGVFKRAWRLRSVTLNIRSRIELLSYCKRGAGKYGLPRSWRRKARFGVRGGAVRTNVLTNKWGDYFRVGLGCQECIREGDGGARKRKWTEALTEEKSCL